MAKKSARSFYARLKSQRRRFDSDEVAGLFAKVDQVIPINDSSLHAYLLSPS